LIRGRISGRDRAGLIDAAIIATGLGLLSWTFLMKPIAADIGYAVLNLVSSYEGGLVDAGWLLSYAIWGTAALHPSMRSLSEVAPDRATRFSHRRLVGRAARALYEANTPAGTASSSRANQRP
jgi:hypothetical protein